MRGSSRTNDHGRAMLEAEESRPLPQGFEDIQRQELSRLFGRMADIRLLVFVPAALALAAALAVAEPARWRGAFLFAVLVPLGVFFILETIRFRREGLTRGAVTVNLLAAVVGQVALAFATGALESPFTYTFVPLAVMIGLFAAPGARGALVAAQVAAVWALAALELSRALPELNLSLFGGGPRAGHVDAHLLASAVVLSIVLAVA